MELNEIALNHLHSLELRETYRTLEILMGSSSASNLLVNKLGGGDQFADEFYRFFIDKPPREEYLDLKIAYYLLAGCGINRVQRALNVAQSRVYRVKEEVMPSLNNLKPCFLDPFIKVHPHIIERIQNIMVLLNVLDGFRILDPSNSNVYMNGQVRN